MRRLYAVLLFMLFCSFAFCEELLEDEIFLDTPVIKGCKLNEFCSKYIDDIDIENFIKQELQNDYVVVSLDECLDVALKNNFNIKIKDHNYKSSNYEFQNALSKFLPILQTESYITDYHGQILVGEVLQDDLHETALSVNLEARHDLTQGGKQIFEAKAKKYFARSRKHSHNFTKSQTLYLTVKYYYEMLQAKVNIEIYLRNLIERNAQLALAQNLKNSGFGTHFDVIRSKSESAQAKISLLRALNDFRLSQAALSNIMGIKVETALMPFEDDILPFHLVDDKLNVTDFFKLAVENREDLKNYRDIVNYEKQIKYTYLTDFAPKPYIIFQQRFQGTVDHSVRPNYLIGGYIDWALGENSIFGTLTKVKAQKEKIKSAKLDIINTLRNIEENIISAYSSSIFNKKEMETAHKRVDWANESIRLAMLRFNNGKGILLDVIQAQTELTQARAEYVSAIIKYNISQTELLYNSGTITKELLIKNYKP